MSQVAAAPNTCDSLMKCIYKMSNYIIETKITKFILRYFLLLIFFLFLLIIFPSGSTQTFLVLYIVAFLLFFKEKHIHKIIVTDSNVRFIFFFLFFKRMIEYDRSSINIEEIKEVHFRGGVKYVLNIRLAMTKKILFKISKGSFFDDCDYQYLLNIES